MSARTILLAGAAGFALVACGEKDPTGETPRPTSAAAVKLSAGSPIDQAFSLSDASTVDVDALLALLPEDFRPTYGAASFDEKLGATVVTELRLSPPELNAELGFGDLLIDRIELYGVDADAIDRAGDVSLAAVDAPMDKVFEKIRAFGISATAGDGEDTGPTGGALTIGALEFDRFSIRQGGVPNDVDANGLAALFNTFDLGGLYLKDAKFDAETNIALGVTEDDGAGSLSTDQETKFAVSLDDIRFVGVGGGRLGAFLANGVEYEAIQSPDAIAAALAAAGPQAALLINSPLKNFIAPGRQTNRYKSIEWRDLDLSGLLSYGLRNETPPFDARDLISIGALEVTDAETLINGKRAALVPLSTVSKIDFTWLAPSRIRAESKDAVYDFTAYLEEGDAPTLNLLKSKGLDNVKADSTLAYDWDADKGGASLATDVLAPKLADLRFNLDMQGFSLDAIEAAMAEGGDDAVASLAALDGLTFELKDGALLDTIYALVATQTGGDADTVRQQAPALLQFAGLQLAGLNPRFSDYIKALSGFLENGGTLTISAAPEKPITFADIAAQTEGQPQNTPDVLNLTVSHKK